MKWKMYKQTTPVILKSRDIFAGATGRQRLSNHSVGEHLEDSTMTRRRPLMGLDWINLEEGKGRFSGPIRGFDEVGHDTFEILMPTRPGLYGEYRPKWADNHNDFDIEIISFGFLDQGYVGSPYPSARQHFSPVERAMIERLTISLFTNVEAQKGIGLFSSKKGGFLGQVHFAPGWIRLNE